MTNTVVFVHGLNGEKYVPEFWKHVIQKLPPHYKAFVCKYNSFALFQECVNQLTVFLERNDIAECIFVGHSLGTLVVKQFLQQHPGFNCDRLLMIFPPTKRPRLIRLMSHLPYSHLLIGRAATEINETEMYDAVPESIEIGVIRGTKKILWKRPDTLLTQPFLLPSHNDGLLRLEETVVAEPHEEIVVHENHMAFPNSQTMVHNITHFVQHGSFVAQTA